MITRAAYDAKKYRKVGARFPSESIQMQGRETAVLWKENLPVFTDYGQGQTELTAFLDLLAEHAAAIVARPRKLTERTLSVAERNATVNEAWIWNK
ncbi:MAG: hypothetical protein CVU65_16150, partial [Deltaproteobacteria bacterium HGW-Deltaproteobacteria-22]